MVYLRTLNSRMKDFYDVWLLARQFAFDGSVLAKAIAATFGNRETAIDVAPIAFTPELTEQASTLAQWTAFRRKLPNTECPETLAEVVPFLSELLLPMRAPAQPARVSSSAGHRAGRGPPARDRPDRLGERVTALLRKRLFDPATLLAPAARRQRLRSRERLVGCLARVCRNHVTAGSRSSCALQNIDNSIGASFTGHAARRGQAWCDVGQHRSRDGHQQIRSREEWRREEKVRQIRARAAGQLLCSSGDINRALAPDVRTRT
ncbi:MAG: nucleotidyl transferase AbiEii/AbiGii toxin family protein [Polyangiaceae bacterium]